MAKKLSQDIQDAKATLKKVLELYTHVEMEED